MKIFPLDALPDLILLQTFRYLSLEEQVRLGRVNKHFRRVSKSAISDIKSLDLCEDRFFKLSSDSFRSILELCSNGLKEIRFNRYGDGMETFVQFSCPRLVKLEMHKWTMDDDSVVINSDTLGQLIMNNRNLKEFSFFAMKSGFGDPVNLPAYVINEHLETLTIWNCDDSVLSSFIGRCPNLRTLRLQLFPDISAGTLDGFFASCPNIDDLDLNVWGIGLESLQKAASLWLLPLRSLSIAYPGRSDGMIIRTIAGSFPQLEEFNCYMEVTNDDIVQLAAHPNIQKITLRRRCVTTSAMVEQGLCQLVRCKNLQYFEIPMGITSTVLVTLVNGCYALRCLKIWGVTDGNPAEIAQSFNGFGANLEIHIRDDFLGIWQTAAVQQALENLKEAWIHG